MTREAIGFTRSEILSFLPTGWVLPPSENGRLDPDGRWIATVYDLADQTWELSIEPEEAARLGRIEALRHAFDKLHRRALGRKGLFG